MKDYKPNILLIDDDIVFINQMKVVLEESEYNLIAESDINKLIYNKEELKDIDLIILDYKFNNTDINGLDICRLYREQMVEYVPILFVTGYESKDKLCEFLKSGADDVLIKPLDNQVLLAKLFSLLRIKKYQDNILKISSDLEQSQIKLRNLNDILKLNLSKHKKELADKTEYLKSLINIHLAFNTVNNFDDLLKLISKEISMFLHADRTTLYVFDEIKNILWSKIAEGLNDEIIQVDVGQGIAGNVAKNGIIMNIEDAYNNELFDKSFDKKYNYETQNILCMPMYNLEKKLIGVIQVMNKKQGSFTKDDEDKLKILTNIAAVSIENTQLISSISSLKEFNETIIDNMSSSILVLNLDKKITMYNKAFGKLFNVKKIDENSSYKNYLGFLDNCEEFVNNTIKNGKENYNKIKANINNEIKYLNISGILFEEEDKNISGVLIIIRNITDIVELEEKAKNQERLSLIGRMASSIIHDIKNPMTTISGYAQIIKSRTTDDSFKEFTSIIENEITSLVAMTREILDFAKGTTQVKTVAIKIKDYMLSLKSYYYMLVKKFNAEFIYDIQSDAVVNIDTEKFKRVLYNIITNSCDALDKENKKISIKVYEQNNKVIIEIEDNGKGISKQNLSEIFKPFFTFGKRQGTGLGMAITKKIIDEHNADIKVESEEKKYTKFIISLKKES